LSSKLDKLESKFLFWRNGLTFKQRKNIKLGIDLAILLLIIGGMVNIYGVVKQNGKVELCESQSGILVEYQGLEECWSQDQYDEYLYQWNTNKYLEESIKNGIQYNFTG